MASKVLCDITCNVLTESISFTDVNSFSSSFKNKQKSFTFDEREEKYIVFGGGHTPTV